MSRNGTISLRRPTSCKASLRRPDVLALAVAVTGILATLPYIALQLVGMQVVIGAMGIGGSGFTSDLPLLIAFIVLATYTYKSGLRAPAMIAFVKDTLIYPQQWLLP